MGKQGKKCPVFLCKKILCNLAHFFQKPIDKYTETVYNIRELKRSPGADFPKQKNVNAYIRRKGTKMFAVMCKASYESKYWVLKTCETKEEAKMWMERHKKGDAEYGQKGYWSYHIEEVQE